VFSGTLALGVHELDMRTSFGASGHRAPNWHESASRGSERAPDRRHDPNFTRQRDAEFTLGLDDEWEDIPTAELDVAAYDEATADVGAPASQPEPSQPEPPVERPKQQAEPLAEIAPQPMAEPAARQKNSVASPVRTPTAEPPPTGKPSRSVSKAAAPQPVAASPDAPTAEPEARPVPRDITTGSLLCDRYLLGRMLGVGGSSVVFQAEDRRRIGAQDFGNRIAIKLLRPDTRHNPHALTRLKREFRQMQRLSHPGVARVFELACDEDIWFMTMELIEGQTINQSLKAGTPRSDGVQLISACCDALSHAHACGVVHGDLKPSNVLVIPNGKVKLVDFGSAAERDAATGAIDKERSFAATPPYASPQVLAGDVAEARDDVYSLACLAYAVLSNGEHPFDRKSSAEAQQAQMRPAYARAIHPRQFEVIARALAWDRDQRPASVREFMHALLASDWRREPNARDSASVDVARPAMQAPPSVASETVSAPIKAEPPSPGQSREPPPLVAEPKLAVTPDDIARLRAAVAAAEAHAERVEKPAGEAKQKETPKDPLDRFRGYVAGPMAQQSSANDASAIGAPDEPLAAGQSKKAKRVWPWQRSAFIVLAIAGTSALLATQFDAEPVHANAQPAVQTPLAVPQFTATQVTAISSPSIAAPQIEEKKSKPVALKATSPPVALGKVSFETRTLEVAAGQTIAALSVTRKDSTRGRARVAWTIEGGTARRGVHYELASPQVIEFLDGQRVRSLFIPLTPDKDAVSGRRSKTFTVKLQQATGGPSLGEIKQVYVTIVGDVTGEPVEKRLVANSKQPSTK
jgi:serine/threonine protein kinase